MAKEEKTQVDDSGKKTEDEDSYEKRYKDSQAHITTIEQENKALREAATKDKELFDAISPFVDWDAASGKTKTATEVQNEDGYVSQKALDKKIKDLQEQMNRDRITQNFRIKYPDMAQYEDLVGVFLGKTDARRPMDERIAKAVDNVKDLIKAERIKGREEFEKEKKEQAAKEAEASGLSEAKGPKGEEKESEGETYEEYLDARKARIRKAQGLPA